jgi:DTW domain-containing protein YfiP
VTDDRCPHCKKPQAICVCDRITPLAVERRLVVLQHPQENDVDLGTAPLLARALPRCTVRVGLSWRSLAHAVDDDGAKPERWAVVYPQKLSPELAAALESKGSLVLDRHGKPRSPAGLEGLVVLDGTWSQAKTLWWRNPWLLKIGRVALSPREPSIYGRMRKEPRREHVSTLEAAADALVAVGEPPEVRDELRRVMRTMIQRARDRRSRP